MVIGFLAQSIMGSASPETKLSPGGGNRGSGFPVLRTAGTKAGGVTPAPPPSTERLQEGGGVQLYWLGAELHRSGGVVDVLGLGGTLCSQPM